MPSQTTTKRKFRGKSDPRMAVVKWARENGAVHIKVDGIELMFPPNAAPYERKDGELTPESIVARASTPPEFNTQASDAVISQHPDEYVAQSDRWANFTPFNR